MNEAKFDTAASDGAQEGVLAVQLIDRRYEVDVGKPLPAFDSPHALACLAHDRENTRASLFALIVEPGIAWRGAALKAQLAIRHPSLLRAVAIGPVVVPGAAQRQAAIILERPHGTRLSLRRGGLKEEQIREFVLPALLDGLQALHDKGIAHRALRPDNLFFLSAREDAVTIGEYFSAPPGHDQPDDFEPVERVAAIRARRSAISPCWRRCRATAMPGPCPISPDGLPSALRPPSTACATGIGGSGSFAA